MVHSTGNLSSKSKSRRKKTYTKLDMLMMQHFEQGVK